MQTMPVKIKLAGIGIVMFFLAACSTGGTSQPEAAFYRPPTQPVGEMTQPPVATPEKPTPTPTEAVQRPTPTPVCSPNLTFLEDITLPDGSVASPGEQLDKRWRVENSGTCNWDSTYRLMHIGGPQLGVTAEQSLYPARSGTQASLQLIFTAPDEPGTYRSAWQAQDPAGEPFGDQIFIEIIIAAP